MYRYEENPVLEWIRLFTAILVIVGIFMGLHIFMEKLSNNMKFLRWMHQHPL